MENNGREMCVGGGVVVDIRSLILDIRSLNGNFILQWRFRVGNWIYGESSGEEDGTGDFNLRIINLERMEKR